MLAILVLVTCLQDSVDTAIKRYEAVEKSAKAEFDSKMKDATEALITSLRATAKAAASKGDLATAQRAMDKLRELGAEVDVPVKGSLKPGLMMAEYNRTPATKGWCPLTELKNPVKESKVKNFSDFKVDKDRNYVLTGYIRVLVGGEYMFRVHSFAGRHQIFIAGKEIVKYGEDSTVVKLKLLPGLFPVTFVTWQDNRNENKLEWQVPGTTELVVIPDEVFGFKEGK